MKTKIVYIATSTNEDCYMEQAFLSAWSAKYFNPNSQIILICDNDTYHTLSSGIRKQYSSLFNKILKIDFNPEQCMMERSRWIKTNLRNLVKDDFLFLDTDTIVCSDLSFIDEFSCEIGLVLNNNCKFINDPLRDGFIRRAKKHFGIDISNEEKYFNSGVIFARNTVKCHQLFNRWHELWNQNKYNSDGKLKDQTALCKANIDMGHVISELSGDLNCQISMSIQYLHTANIIHFFNTSLGSRFVISPFLGKDIYHIIKKEGITSEIQQQVLNCKSSFSSPSMPVPLVFSRLWLSISNDTELLKSNSYQVLHKLYKSNSFFYKINEEICSFILKCARKIRK